MNIYIGCGLTHVPRDSFEEYTLYIHQLADQLSDNEKNSVQYALMHSDPQLASKPPYEKAKLCYLWDRRMVENSDVLIAEASFPSTGLGIEMQIAEGKGIPIIICFREINSNRAEPIAYKNPDQTKHDLQTGEGFVSLMALGMPSVFQVIKYIDYEDGIAHVIDSVKLLRCSVPA
jgi:hypothetical protein